ncbi:MAG TPA: phosphatidylglycerol lysyltransferase domain-containing protein [Pseudonocardiaceae bacterium]|nr:phosphatidylglycerol lysyltransferase domain-containing protein [Pseudonocardiaceae bacterium]
MTVSTSESQVLPRWLLPGATTVGLIVWATRLVGLLTLAAVMFPVARRHFHDPLTVWFDLPVQATVAGRAIATVAGVCLLLLATGLRRRKRRAWQVVVGVTALIAVVHLLVHRTPVPGITAIALLIVLITYQGEFTALPDPAVSKWRALRIFVEILLAGAVINTLVLTLHHNRDLDSPTAIGVAFGLGAVVIGGYFLLRSAEPAPSLSPADVAGLRALMGADSLDYFALRRDKSAVFSASAKSAIAYRVLAGVALTSGDPLGDVEAWPGAIEEYLAICQRHAWVPAVLGCSERAATVWSRYGLDVLELGDEAIVDVSDFTLEGRRMRGVRQAVARVRRSGYEVQVRRTAEIPPATHEALAKLADEWRGTATERGFSMALSRLADEEDGRCVVVTAEQAGSVRGMLQFVPWGCDGLSLDLMRRDRDVPDNGLNEFMITSLLAASPGLGVRQVSLNFAMFRAALERGERIGAGPVARLWAKALRLGSRWWQIESLYRFNAKFAPRWLPRYLVFPAARDLPRIALAAIEAEGFGGRPPALLRMLRRH